MTGNTLYISNDSTTTPLIKGDFAGDSVTVNGQLLVSKNIVARHVPKSGTVASSATPTINTDLVDAYDITALSANITSFTTNLSGTPVNFQKLLIRIKDDATPRTIAWGASFASGGVTLPVTTVTSKVLMVLLIYDSVSAKWVCWAADSLFVDTDGGLSQWVGVDDLPRYTGSAHITAGAQITLGERLAALVTSTLRIKKYQPIQY